MIYYMLAIGLGWIVLTAVATLTMLATVALNVGREEASRAIVSELPLVFGLASPGLAVVLIALLSLALAGRRARGKSER